MPRFPRRWCPECKLLVGGPCGHRLVEVPPPEHAAAARAADNRAFVKWGYLLNRIFFGNPRGLILPKPTEWTLYKPDEKGELQPVAK